MGVVAAIYASAQIALAPLTIVIVPGVLLFRPSNIFTMLLGVLFGPAGAIGVGLGNAIGDFFTGGLGVGSIFGALSTFCIGYIGYGFVSHLGVRDDGKGSTSIYIFASLVAAAASAVTLGWGLQILGLAPFQLTSNVIVINFFVGDCVGYGLYIALKDRVKALKLDDDSDVQERKGRPAYRRLSIVGGFLVSGGSLSGWIVGAFFHGGIVTISVYFFAVVAGLLLL